MASTYLSRTVGAGNRQTWTWSVWIKRNKIGTSQCLFDTYVHGNDNFRTNFADTDKVSMRFYNGTEYELGTNRVFRDTNAWYHLVFVADTTNSTADDRFRIYVNGVRETVLHLMSHVHFCDGTAYDASAFGSTDATTGEWKINTSPSITMGTNGFTILKDGNTITDQSSNSNNFTLGGGTLTKSEDCPSNVFCVLNSETGQSTCSYTNGNLKTASTSDGHRIFGTIPSKAGYYEVKLGEHPSGSNGKGFVWGVTDITNYNESNNWNITATRFMKTNYGYDTHFATENFGGGNSWENVTTSLDADAGDILMCAWKNGKVYYGYNGTWFFSANPSNNTDGSTQVPLTDSNAYQLPVFKSNLDGANGCEFNFGNGFFGTTEITTSSGSGFQDANGQGRFYYQPPTGCYALCTKNLNL